MTNIILAIQFPYTCSSSIKMTECEAYQAVKDLQQPMADHIYQLALPVRQSDSNNITGTSMQSDAFGCDETAQNVYESIM